MFGRDETFDEMKAALAATGADMAAFRSWQKQYEKVNRQWQSVRTQYDNAKAATEWMREEAEHMERMINGEKAFDAKVFAQIIREMKRRAGSFDHEFLISAKDHEFHSTYDTIVRLGAKACEQADRKLILQSEIENLLSLVREALDKEHPSTWKLAFYLTQHSQAELEELPPVEKMACVNRNYEEQFMQPIVGLLTKAIRYADAQREACAGQTDRRSRRFLEATEVFVRGADTKDSAESRARRIVGQIAESR